MFGRKKDDQGMERAKEIGQQIGAMATDYIDNYCSRIVFYQASQMLLQFGREIDELPPADPLDDEANKERVFRLTKFIVASHNGLQPLKRQLVAQIDQQYGGIFERDAGLRELFGQLVEKRFSEHEDNISAAASYLIGISSRYMNQLLGIGRDEAL